MEPVPTQHELAGILNKWSIPWEIAGILVNGDSSLDLKRMPYSQPEEIALFVKNYGYDLSREDDQRFIHAMIIEGLFFIWRRLIPEELASDLKPPAEIFECDSVSLLMRWAAEKTKKTSYRQGWACALLRVMHTISHIEDVKRITNKAKARQKIMGRFEKYSKRDQMGRLWFGVGDDAVEIEKIEFKSFKTRESIILKLLHKRANIAETIYDLMGVRIVTKSLKDIILVVKNLTKYQMVTFPNTHPSRARNTLINFEKMEILIQEKLAQAREGQLSVEDFYREINRADFSILVDGDTTNPHSAQSYHSLQLTSRQLLRLTNENFAWLKKLKAVYQSGDLAPKNKKMLGEIIALVDDWSGIKQKQVEAVFFPYEVQIMDKDSYLQNQYGDASYDRYKMAQVKTARRRVLGPILKSV